MHIAHLLFYTHGRISRKVWWITNIAMWILSIVTLWVWHKFGFHDAIFGMVLTITLFYFRVNVNIKRLHDRGKTGWRIFSWWLFSELIPPLGWVSYGCLKGSETTNEHGEPVA